MPPKRKRAAAEDKKTVSPPKTNKGEKAEETPESSEAVDSEEVSVNYSMFYSEFAPRALDTIRDS